MYVEGLTLRLGLLFRALKLAMVNNVDVMNTIGGGLG